MSTPLTADRNTPTKDGKQYAYPCEASKTFFAGALVVINAAGNAEPATAATGKKGAGRCIKAITSSAVAGAEKVIVEKGVFQFKNGESITKASVGALAYADDDQTLFTTSTGRSSVGTITDVDSDGVWVQII